MTVETLRRTAKLIQMLPMDSHGMHHTMQIDTSVNVNIGKNQNE
jgi:stalled ribosome rescue protein Dom34